MSVQWGAGLHTSSGGRAGPGRHRPTPGAFCRRCGRQTALRGRLEHGTGIKTAGMYSRPERALPQKEALLRHRQQVLAGRPAVGLKWQYECGIHSHTDANHNRSLPEDGGDGRVN
jgi:hypothetical protein